MYVSDISQGALYLCIFMATYSIQFLAFRVSTWHQFNAFNEFWRLQAISATVRVVILLIFYKHMSFELILLSNLIATATLTYMYLKNVDSNFIKQLRLLIIKGNVRKINMTFDGSLRTYLGFLEQTLIVFVLNLGLVMNLMDQSNFESAIVLIPYIIAANLAARTLFYGDEIRFHDQKSSNSNITFIVALGLSSFLFSFLFQSEILLTMVSILNLTAQSSELLLHYSRALFILYPFMLGFLSVEALSFKRLKNFYVTFILCFLSLLLIQFLLPSHLNDFVQLLFLLIVPTSLAVSLRKTLRGYHG